MSKPAAADLAGVREYVARARTRPTAVDLFCGAGGLSLGLERAGFDVLVGADSDDWAVRTHHANCSGMSWHGDLTDPTEFLHTLGAWGIERVDLVAGGVPCQPFSRAGQPRIRGLIASGGRADHDVRADLWSSFVAVVRRLKPAAVLVENVPDLPRWNDGAVLMSLYESLQELGYRVEARIVDGFRHGVPQHRQRLILIGIDGNRRPVWPESEGTLVNLRDAIGDLPPIPRAQRAEKLSYDPNRMSSDFQELMRRDVRDTDRGVVFEHICRDVRSDDMNAYRLLQEGQTYMDLPEHLQRYRSDVFSDKYKRLAWPELCRSITAHIAKDGYWYIHPDQHRTLSIREAARVQSFPDHFRFAGTQTHRYRQIGNAVPVLLAEAIGGAVLTALQQTRRERRAPDEDTLRSLLLSWQTSRATWSAPWRTAGTDPWTVLLRELLLARARPDEAERLHRELGVLAPDPAALLAHPDPEGELEAIGLGVRAPTVVELAREVVARHGGCLPSDDMELRALPGVGDSVCRGVLTFGFGRRQVLVDRTTARVGRRLAGHHEDRRFQLRLDLHRLAGAVGPDAAFNSALLDLGREVCHVGVPECGACPLVTQCRYGMAAPSRSEVPVPAKELVIAV